MKSYIRFLTRNKLYTAIMVVGLSVALAFVIPLISFFCSLKQITKGHENYENIYSMCCMDTQASSPGFGAALKERIPEIEYVTSPILDNRIFNVNESRKKINYVDKSFFYFFPCSFTYGNSDFIDVPGTAAISADFAAELEKEGQVIGRNLNVGENSYVVSAIFDEYGSGVLVECDMIVSNKSIVDSKQRDFPFGVRGAMTLFSVNPSADMESLDEKVKNVALEYWGNQGEEYQNAEAYRFIRYDKMTTGNEQFIGIKSYHHTIQLIIGALCLLLFFVAILNYINLNIALTNKRAKEMALRKLNGAEISAVLAKYCLESLAFTAVCFAFGLILSKYSCEILNMFVYNSGMGDFRFTIDYSGWNIPLYIGLIVFTGLVCGIIPAVISSRFSPLDICNGDFRFHSKKYLNRFFIGFQSVLSLVLISVTLLLEAQYMQKKRVDYNCDIDDVFFYSPVDRDDHKLDEIYNLLKGKSEILNIGFTEGMPGKIGQDRAVAADGSKFKYACMFCDENAFDTFGFEILEQSDSEDKNGFWLTPFAAQTFEENPGLFEDILKENNITSMRIAGEIQNIPSYSYLPIDDCITLVSVIPSGNLSSKDLAIRTISDHKTARKVIADAYKTVYGKEIHDIMQFEKFGISQYVKEFHLTQIEEFHTMLKLFRIIMALVIFMSMMGLVGISIYYASERRHEIAVRKVFGGTISTETVKNLKNYIRMTLIADIIAVPIIFFLFRVMTMNIADKVESTWWIYIVAIVISFIISIVSVLWQTIDAARTNPAETLKKE